MKLQVGTFAPILLVLALLAGSFLTGCLKYEPLTADEINYDGSDAPAVITLSDPQIYARETLVNDRRREVEYLEELLEDSKDATFEPQIRRDLRTLTSTVLQLQAGYDRLAGAQAARQDGLDEIDARIAETQKLQQLAEARAGLIEAQRKLEELAEQRQELISLSATEEDEGGGDGGSGDGDDDGEGDGDGAEADGEGATPDPGQEEPEKEVEALRADLDRLEALIARLPSTAEVRQAAVGATPREVFRDRQAYRAELRGALAEVELDDAHDQGQNSLYRLQFRATVMPGEHQDKMGAARLTLRPPKLTKEDVVELYKTWLGHVTYRLNQAAGDGIHHDTSYLLLGMGLDRSLFHSSDIEVGDQEIFIALPPRIYAVWKRVTPKGIQHLKCRILSIRPELGDVFEDGDLFHEYPECRVWKSELQSAKNRCQVGLLRDLSRIEPYMSASLRGVGDINSISDEVASEIHVLIETMVDASDTLDRFRRHQLSQTHSCAEALAPGTSVQSQFCAVPQSFRNSIVGQVRRDPCWTAVDDDEYLGTARGGADVYATAPVELAQQISTTASAVRSFETALGLAASLPTEGVNANVGLKRLQAVRSNLEASERLPQVVGFAERKIRDGDGDHGYEEDPRFGWVFGPQATLDAKEKHLRLRRPVVNYPVTVDLSIPGWWPRIWLALETRWIGHWHRGTLLGADWDDSLEPPGPKAPAEDCTEGNRSRCFRVFLPLNRADLDGLTEYLAQKTVGGALAYTSIASVSPTEITTCEDRVTFLVQGANLWRSSKAFLNGLEAREIQVLPDMGGLAVTFEGIREGLPQIPGTGGDALLTVWTRNGPSTRKVAVRDPEAAGLRCGPAEKPALKLAVGPRPFIKPQADGDMPRAELRIVQGELPTSYHELAISVRPAQPLAKGVMAAWSDEPDRTAARSGERIEGPVHWPSLEENLGGRQWVNGEALHVSLVEVPVPGAQGKRHPVDGVLVFYASAEESKIRIETERVADLESPIVLRFPARYDRAYPKLQAGEVTFRVKRLDALHDDYEFSLTEPTPKDFPDARGRDDERRRSVKLKVQKNGKDLNDTEVEEFLATERKITFEVEREGTPAWALPAFAGEVAVGKKAED